MVEIQQGYPFGMIMHLFNLDAAHLRLLNAALDGQLATALADAVRAGGDLELLAIRERPEPTRPSTWTLVVRARDFERRFEMEKATVGLGVLAQIYLTDLVDDLKVDLAATVHGRVPLDEPLPWPRHRRDESS